jgi:hypothetical protein
MSETVPALAPCVFFSTIARVSIGKWRGGARLCHDATRTLTARSFISNFLPVVFNIVT